MFFNVVRALKLLMLIMGSSSTGISFDNTICGSKNFIEELPFCLKKDYKKDMPPSIDSSLDVFVDESFQTIEEVNDAESTITLTLQLGLAWAEPRMEIIYNSSAWHDDDLIWTDLNLRHLKNLWKPDIDIRNVKEFKINELFDKQGSLTLYGNKRMMYYFPLHLKLYCPEFNFEMYPFDSQTCKFIIGSYQHSNDTIKFNGDVIYSDIAAQTIQYHITSIQPLSFTSGLITFEESYYTPNDTWEYEDVTYSHFIVEMKLDRILQSHLISTYFPSLLLVVSSWFGFLVDPVYDPVGRISLSFMLLLVLMNMRYK